MIDRWICDLNEEGVPMMYEDAEGLWMASEDVIKLFEELYQLSLSETTHGTTMALVQKLHHQINENRQTT